MKLTIIAVGTKMPAWVEQGFSEYSKRLPREWKPKLVEVSVAKRSKSSNVEQLKEQEANAILAAIPKNSYVVALEVSGASWTTPTLSEKMAQWQHEPQNICLLIGGPDGLAETCLSLSRERWSLSALTLPHPLVRIVLIEQLYRAWTILQNHPYHK